MFKTLNSIIENNVSESKLDFYSVIIGTKPSQGARSPKLWNKVYNFEKKRGRMIPLDVKEVNLELLFGYLKEDKFCLGGAVAVPYKEKIFDLIKDNVGKEIKNIGAVNCFYRPSSYFPMNEFQGANTDGEAALEPIKGYLKKNKNLTIGLLGFGGAGKAILAFLLKYFNKQHNIKLFNRSGTNIKDARKIDVEIYSLYDLDAHLPNFDLLINSTSVGHVENTSKTVVSPQLLAKAKNTMIVYDIIYDPEKTTLLKNSEELGLRTINGLYMNLFQAVLAYNYTNPTSLSLEQIYNTMN